MRAAMIAVATILAAVGCAQEELEFSRVAEVRFVPSLIPEKGDPEAATARAKLGRDKYRYWEALALHRRSLLAGMVNLECKALSTADEAVLFTSAVHIEQVVTDKIVVTSANLDARSILAANIKAADGARTLVKEAGFCSEDEVRFLHGSVRMALDALRNSEFGRKTPVVMWAPTPR